MQHMGIIIHVWIIHVSVYSMVEMTLDQFHFIWLKSSVIQIGKAAVIPLRFNHLNWNPS